VNLTAETGRTFTQFLLQAVYIGTDGKVRDPTPLGEFTNLDDAQISTARVCAGNVSIQTLYYQIPRGFKVTRNVYFYKNIFINKFPMNDQHFKFQRLL